MAKNNLLAVSSFSPCCGGIAGSHPYCATHNGALPSVGLSKTIIFCQGTFERLDTADGDDASQFTFTSVIGQAFSSVCLFLWTPYVVGRFLTCLEDGRCRRTGPSYWTHRKSIEPPLKSANPILRAVGQPDQSGGVGFWGGFWGRRFGYSCCCAGLLGLPSRVMLAFHLERRALTAYFLKRHVAF